MIEHYLGPQKFRAGVQAYIREHRESNAVAADLWNALEKASGQPVAQIVRAWVRQPGFPLVSFERGDEHKAILLRVKEDRFQDTHTNTLEDDQASTAAADGGQVRRERAFTASSAPAAPCEGEHPGAGRRHVPWYYGNVGEGGFYRVLHDPACLAALAPDLATSLTAVERMARSTPVAIVRAGRARIASFLDLVTALGGDRLRGARRHRRTAVLHRRSGSSTPSARNAGRRSRPGSPDTFGAA
jgi:aminopeptidase N